MPKIDKLKSIIILIVHRLNFIFVSYVSSSILVRWSKSAFLVSFIQETMLTPLPSPTQLLL